MFVPFFYALYRRNIQKEAEIGIYDGDSDQCHKSIHAFTIKYQYFLFNVI